jgi:hypothetical protein
MIETTLIVFLSGLFCLLDPRIRGHYILFNGRPSVHVIPANAGIHVCAAIHFLREHMEGRAPSRPMVFKKMLPIFHYGLKVGFDRISFVDNLYFFLIE